MQVRATVRIDKREGLMLTHGDERLAVAAARQGGQEGVLADLAGLQAAVRGAAIGFLCNSTRRVTEELTQRCRGQSRADKYAWLVLFGDFADHSSAAR